MDMTQQRAKGVTGRSSIAPQEQGGLGRGSNTDELAAMFRQMNAAQQEAAASEFFNHEALSSVNTANDGPQTLFQSGESSAPVEPAKSLNWREQANVLAQSPDEASEQMGIPLHLQGDLFGHQERTAKKLQEQRDRLKAITERQNQKAEVLSAEGRAQQDYTGRTAENDQKVMREIRTKTASKKYRLSAGAQQALSLHTEQRSPIHDSSLSKLLREILKYMKPQETQEIYHSRKAKMAAHRGGMEMGAAASKPDMMASMTERAQAEAIHEFSDSFGE